MFRKPLLATAAVVALAHPAAALTQEGNAEAKRALTVLQRLLHEVAR